MAWVWEFYHKVYRCCEKALFGYESLWNWNRATRVRALPTKFLKILRNQRLKEEKDQLKSPYWRLLALFYYEFLWFMQDMLTKWCQIPLRFQKPYTCNQQLFYLNLKTTYWTPENHPSFHLQKESIQATMKLES